MGGEWFFTIEGELSESQLQVYQAILPMIKKKHENQFDEGGATWASVDEAIETNVFATFQYSCSRHNKNHSWCLYWNPNEATEKRSDVHARCSPFTSESVKIQNKLIAKFSSAFDLFLGDGITGYDGDYYLYNDRSHQEEEFTPYSGPYQTGNGETVWAMAGEAADLTACDKECGYCGRCQY